MCECCGCWPAEPYSELCADCQKTYRVKHDGAVKTITRKERR